jgi:hypothetical protein
VYRSRTLPDEIISPGTVVASSSRSIPFSINVDVIQFAGAPSSAAD